MPPSSPDSKSKPVQVHALSAYEFARHYHMKMARRPLTENTHKKHVANPELYEAKLTHEGLEKVSGAKGRKPTFVASADYEIQEEGGQGWIPLGKGKHVQKYRHDWVIVPRKRPYVPVIYGGQGSKTEQEQAMRILVLFFPWVNDATEANEEIPFIGDFWNAGMRDWREALRTRVMLFGFPTEEVKRFAMDFCFVYCLPRSLALQDDLAPNSDNEVEDDMMLTLDEDDIAEATLSYVRGGSTKAGGRDPTQDDGLEPQDSPEAEGSRPATTLHDLTMEMFRRSEAIWLAPDRLGKTDPATMKFHTQMQEAGPVRDHDRADAAAKASRNQAQDSNSRSSSSASHRGLVGLGSVQALPPINKAMLQGFLESDRVLQHANPKQLEFLELVVDRLLVEAGLITKEESLRQSEEPLLWLLHGPPGTGKSYALSLVRELFNMMGWAYGLDYEVVAFQAVNAADLHGKTIHTAFGFDQTARVDVAASREVAQKMAHWRWLIIDEISLTDAALLAKAEHRLRAEVPSASNWKHGPDGRVRPFAGLNVIFTGDFHQLPPPGGAYLADIPRSFVDPSNVAPAGNALAEYGKQLFWYGSVQGVTELTERERCKDEWWNEVVDQWRAGRLSEANHRYLHGWAVDGCTLTEEERRSRQRVVSSPADPRLMEEKFKEAPAIVANNDSRYQINKDRAKSFSQATGAPLRWAIAVDRAGVEVLQTQACDKAARIRHRAWKGQAKQC